MGAVEREPGRPVVRIGLGGDEDTRDDRLVELLAGRFVGQATYGHRLAAVVLRDWRPSIHWAGMVRSA